MKRFAIVGMSVLLGAGLVAGCSSSSDSSDASSSVASSSGPPVTLNVSAAASLKKAFTEIADEYQKQHAGTTVKLSFDGSATLANQINQGAPVDVFASADEKNMTKIGDKAVDPKIFATNTLVIVTAAGNPKGIGSLADLQKPAVTTALCAVPQPCGNASVAAEQKAGVTITPVSEEPSVTAVLTKVTSGQVDAGLVYVSDAKGAGDKVSTVADPAFGTVVNKYPIATVKGAANASSGTGFVSFVLSPEGQKVLSSLGFGAP